MELLSFAITVIILTTSGALAPGPLFFVTIAHGVRSGMKSGIIFSITHMIIEFTLVMLLALGLLSVANESIVRLFVGIAGGLSLIIFGFIQIHSCLNQTKGFELSKGSTRNLFLIGFTLTGLNPYFIIWWLTIGVNLIFMSLEFAGLFGVIFMYFCHVWVDYVWLTLISGLAKRSLKILQFKWFRLMIMIFGGILIYFGIYFIIDALIF